MRIADDEEPCAYYKDENGIVHDVAWCTNDEHVAIVCTVTPVRATTAKRPYGTSCSACIAARKYK